MFYEFSAAVMAHLRTKELNQIWEFGVFVFVFSFLKIWSEIVHTHTQRTVIHFDIWAIPENLGFSKTKNLETLPATNHGATWADRGCTWGVGEGGMPPNDQAL